MKEKDYGTDQFGIPYTKSDIKMNFIVGLGMAITFVGGLILLSCL